MPLSGLRFPKLVPIGIKEVPFDLNSSYISNSYQFAHINSTKSNKNFINYRIPQGSVLGPVLIRVC